MNERESASQDRGGDILSLVSGTSRPRFGELTIHTAGRLPHWRADDAIYFVTFRLQGSLPRAIEDERRHELHVLQLRAASEKRTISSEERRRAVRRLSRRLEEELDKGHGACYLRDERAARIVADAIRYFDGGRYRLFAWCIMPNHVHVVLRPRAEFPLEKTMQSWKSFTAKAINRALGLMGSFWEREYYDHLIRDDDDFWHAVEYVLENPAKANLVDWPWVWAEAMCRQDADTTGDGTSPPR